MSIVCNNLKRIILAFYAAGEDIPLGMSTFGLIIHGSIILVGTTDIMCRNALGGTFDVSSDLNSWSKVGTVPHTRKCLTSLKVHHDGTDKCDPNFMSSRTSSPRTTTALPSSMSWDTEVAH